MGIFGGIGKALGGPLIGGGGDPKLQTPGGGAKQFVQDNAAQRQQLAPQRQQAKPRGLFGAARAMRGGRR